MRHVEGRAQHIADAVARAHRHAGRQRRPSTARCRSGNPCRASRSRGSAFTRGSPCGEHREPLHRLRVGIRVRLARADAFDAMVDGADAGRQEQPFRRVHGDGGIEDGRARHDERMPQHLLHLRALVGDAGDGAELAAGDRGRHADLAHGRRRSSRGASPLARRGCASMPSTSSDVVGEASCTALAPSVIEPPPTVTIRSAFGVARRVGGGDHRLARRMRRHRVEHAGAARAERAADLRDLVGLAVQRAADHQEGAARRAGPSARRPPRRRAGRTPPRPSRRKRHVPCARLSSRTIRLVLLGAI